MDRENRPVSGHVESATDRNETQALRDACYGNFYAVCDLLYRSRNDAVSLRTEPEQETLRFRASASIAFPVRDIESLEKTPPGSMS